jgi:predicted dehydrogenase
VVLICADTPSPDPVELAGVVARDRGRVVAVGAVGLNIPRKVYYEKELSFINSRSYGPGRYDPHYEEGGHDYPLGYVRWTEGRNLQAFVDLLGSRQIDVTPLITHRFPIEQAPAAYDLITGKSSEPFLGVLLTYPPLSPDSPNLPIRIQPESKSPQSGKSASLAPIVRLGVLGAGNFATAVMLPVIRRNQHIERIAIASAAGLHAQHAAQKFGFRYAAANEDQILSDPNINTIAILTRHNLHAGQVVRALKAAKYVFCEKPLAITSDQLTEIRQQLYSMSEPPLLMVGYNRRFAPMARRLADFLQPRKEPLIAHYRINAGFIPLNHWVHDLQQGGGRIIGEGCHFIDFLTFLVGNPPSSVYAHALPDNGRYREDNVVLTFGFPDGSLGTVTYLANGDKTFPKERIEVFCSGKVAVLDDFRSLIMVEDGRRQVIKMRLRQDKGHSAEWDAFVAAVQAGGPPPIPSSHLFGVTEATLSAIESLRSRASLNISSDNNDRDGH